MLHDFSDFTEPWMDTQLNVGNDSGFLRAEWTDTGNGWILRESDLY